MNYNKCQDYTILVIFIKCALNMNINEWSCTSSHSYRLMAMEVLAPSCNQELKFHEVIDCSHV